MIGIMELGCGSFVEMEWPFYLLFIVNDRSITHSMPVPHQRIFLFYAPVTLPQPGWGRIAEQVQVLVA